MINYAISGYSQRTTDSRASQMLTKRTVLVLGAGASKPYNYPTGVELSQLIVNQLTAGNHQQRALVELCEFSPNDVENFRLAFYRSGKDSIDAFLEHRTDLMVIGKAAIAAVLIAFQTEWHLFRYDAPSWLRYIYNRLNTAFDDFGTNQLSIITFNYDRTVEHFFFRALQNTYNKSDEECRKALSAIPIIHLHGTLGKLPWQGSDGVLYDPSLTKESLAAAVNNIKIIHEEITDVRDKEFTLAKRLMSDADRILILGFGYYPLNVQRLGLSTLVGNKTFGTALNLRNAEMGAVLRTCNGKIRLEDCDCLTLVRDFIIWD